VRNVSVPFVVTSAWPAQSNLTKVSKNSSRNIYVNVGLSNSSNRRRRSKGPVNNIEE